MRKYSYPTLISLVAIVMLIVYMSDFHSGRANHFFSSPQLTIPADMSYQQYMMLKDSADRLEIWKKQRVGAHGFPGQQLSTGFVGVRLVSECDSCSPYQVDIVNAPIKYFLQLPGYYFRNDTSGFNFFERNRFYLDSKQPRFAFSPEDPERPGSVLIPLSEGSFNVLRVFVRIYSILGILVFLYFVVARPLKVLINIANGQAFIADNYRILSWAGYVMIAGAILQPLLSLVLNLFFHSNIPDEVGYYFGEHLLRVSKLFITGIAVLVLAHAFRRGYYLQEEQKFTI